ncbi:hypothetical protein AUEXF2481DRAFT_635730 [Aureobasidium subglaciale EXF-2481]|uniref:Uncharacterized protein n=1 Tax=Aureobasidium subglaciale (strain EXF-2481) TaxID=1043005 RepID=A0A074YF41_AURSE|nr:uncharacterized protein AUEXF2481DRAFT_635730 [Aureobasidium subglaciale EXF-2481]KAI5201212.1 hypothetical protein E4T38_06180 [Aureobasidium subglaciale]KAI5219829.1 hypothetical protein E4T40_06201 [Aureobasidium subglaciale]KAI5223661.1 hypothetical protein E4T41_05996 [Aureobasidium subglaciale]KAI5260526.1 hypothetical protein E4T46_05935 [Aureobasidium subglaciale]KEQ96370.1 hypothetical protein AUEXF2481DRAFT_635730 [Aureobasidium subglaciale EXF-2481]
MSSRHLRRASVKKDCRIVSVPLLAGGLFRFSLSHVFRQVGYVMNEVLLDRVVLSTIARSNDPTIVDDEKVQLPF